MLPIKNLFGITISGLCKDGDLMGEKIKYCPKCGNTGIDIDGNVCSCSLNIQNFFNGVSCLDIPEQFQGVHYSELLVSRDMPEAYCKFLKQLHSDITTCRLKFKNIAICSPPGRSKTTFAYSCMEALFRQGIPTFPLFDMLEIKRIITDTDMCRKQFYDVEHPENLVQAPYLFARVPRVTTWEVYDTMSTLLDRRVRRGGCTIFLYNGTWEEMTFNDKHNIIRNLSGDGSGGSIENKTWFPKSEDVSN